MIPFILILLRPAELNGVEVIGLPLPGSAAKVATATASEYKAMDSLTHLSEEVMSCSPEDLTERYGVYFFDSPEKSAISREMLSFHKIPCTAMMVLPLMSEEQIVGHLVCITEGKQQFTDEHARLISSLSKPFAIALSNTLKHRSEIKLYDRNFFWEATTRICGTLQIETVLWQSLLFLQDYMPAEEIAFLYFDQDKDTYKLYAHADKSAGRIFDHLVAYPPEIRDMIKDKNFLVDYLNNQADENAIIKPVLLLPSTK